MNRKELLKKHMATLMEKKAAFMKAHEDFKAHEKSFMAWLCAELKIEMQGGEMLLPEILAKWDDANDIASKS